MDFRNYVSLDDCFEERAFEDLREIFIEKTAGHLDISRNAKTERLIQDLESGIREIFRKNWMLASKDAPVEEIRLRDSSVADAPLEDVKKAYIYRNARIRSYKELCDSAAFNAYTNESKKQEKNIVVNSIRVAADKIAQRDLALSLNAAYHTQKEKMADLNHSNDVLGYPNEYERLRAAYSFHKAVDIINNSAKENEKKKKAELISAQTGQQLFHDFEKRLYELCSKLTANPQNRDTILHRNIRTAIADALEQAGYANPFISVDVNGKRTINGAYKKSLDYFDEMVSRKNIKDALLPISPYDSKFSNLLSVQKAGCDPVYLPLGSMHNEELRVQDLYTPDFTKRIELCEVERRQDGRIHPKLNRDKEICIKPENFFDESDMTGLSLLTPYIDAGDIQEIQEWVSRGMLGSRFVTDLTVTKKGASFSNKGKRKDKEKVFWTRLDWNFMPKSLQSELVKINNLRARSALAILEMLEKEGMDYRIRKDHEAGQIKAVIDKGAGRTEIRLMDKPDNGKYIGRVQAGGIRYNFTPRTSITEMETAFGIKPVRDIPYDLISPQDRADLVKVALNRPVYDRSKKVEERNDSDLIGFNRDIDGRTTNNGNTAKIKRDHACAPLDTFKCVCPYVELIDPDTGFVNAVIHNLGITSDKVGGYSSMTEKAFVSDDAAFAKISKQLNKANANAVYAGQEAVYTRLFEKIKKAWSANPEFPDEYADEFEKHAYKELAATPKGYLALSIKKARENFEKKINPEQVFEIFEAHKDDPNYMPDFYGEKEIKNTLMDYYQVLLDAENGDSGMTYIRSPKISEAQYKELLKQDPNKAAEYLIVNEDPKAAIREHAKQMAEMRIGHFEFENNKVLATFNPVGVSVYLPSGYSPYMNQKNMTNAMLKLGMNGLDFPQSDKSNLDFKENLIYFNSETARKFSEVANESPFAKEIYQAIQTSLKTTGAMTDDPDDPFHLMIDDQGIVQYRCSISSKSTREPGKDTQQVIGTIGQILIPDAKNRVKTKFLHKENYYAIPRYHGFVRRQKPGENKSVAERMVLTGYEKDLISAIQQQIRLDLINTHKDLNAVCPTGKATALNHIIKGLSDQKLDLDYADEARLSKTKMPVEALDAIIESQSRSIRLNDDLVDKSSIHQEIEQEERDAQRAQLYAFPTGLNDNFRDSWTLSGNKNMAIPADNEPGYFEANNTGTGATQGKILHLVEGAVVNPDGTITPGNPDARDPLSDYLNKKCQSDNDAIDRQMMDTHNMKSAKSITKPVQTAMMTFGGWNQDDGIIISSDFAEEYQVGYKDAEGVEHFRPLKKQDKLDAHGNKGVITLVIDRHMSEKDAREQGIYDQWLLFNKNPNLDVVTSPFSLISRSNGGIYQEAKNDVHDLIMPDGSVAKGCIGSICWIVTDKTAEDKTSIYTDEEIKKGKGRRVSPLQVAALQSKDCEGIIRQCFRGNGQAYGDVADIMRTLGIEMDETSAMSNGLSLEKSKTYNIVDGPDPNMVRYLKSSLGYSDSQIRNSLSDEFAMQISDKGGMLRLPFSIKLKNEELVPQDEDGSYLMPLLNPHLRNEMDDDSGIKKVSDYTRLYTQIYQRLIDLEIKKMKSGNIESEINAAQKNIQGYYNEIANLLVEKKIECKKNMFKENLMSHRMRKSATAVWSADPRLHMDEIGISPDIAKTLAVKDGEPVMMWRDPIWRPDNIKCVKVYVDDSLTGVSVNPSLAPSMDGDFDGDSVGLLNLNLNQEKVRHELESLSMAHNMINFMMTENDHNSPKEFLLNFQTELDIAAAQSRFEKTWNELSDAKKNEFDRIAALPDVRTKKCEFADGQSFYETVQAEWPSLKKDINDYAKAADAGQLTAAQAHKIENFLFERVSRHLDHCYKVTSANYPISFASPYEHVQSINRACVQTGAKGSEEKVIQYCAYAGIEPGVDEQGHLSTDPATYIDHGKRLNADRKTDIDQQTALAIKSGGTGIAGQYTMNGLQLMRYYNEATGLKNGDRFSPYSPLGILLSLTYPATQKMLQIKKDPVEAKNFFRQVKYTVKNIWSGKYIQDDGTLKSLKLFPEIWTDQTVSEFEKLGFNVNRDAVRQFAEMVAIIDPKTDCRVMPDARKGYMSIDRTLPLDRMAYTHKFDDLVEMAKKRRLLYEGPLSQMYAPEALYENIQRANDETYELKNLESRTLSEKPKEKIKVGKEPHTYENPVQPEISDESNTHPKLFAEDFIVNDDEMSYGL